MLVEVEDRRKIKKVHFKSSELFRSEAEQMVIDLYNNIIETEDQLNEARELVRSLEKEVKEKKMKFSCLEGLFDLEFETKEQERVETQRVMLGIVNPGDPSN